MQSRSKSNMSGCDLSHYHADVDVKSAPDIIYLKASEGQHTKDNTFDSFYRKVKAAGKKAGAYHFFHVGGGYSVDPQVENAVSAVSGKTFDCLFGIDVEDGGYHGGTQKEITAQVLSFAEKFTAKTKIPCCVYASTSFIKEHFTKDIKKLPLWVAHYGVEIPGDNGIWDKWAGFQYTDKPYDMDEFTQDIFIASGNVSAGTQNEAKKPVTASVTRDVYAVQKLSHDWNAKAGTDFDVRNSDGSTVKGRQVYSGDKLVILSVDFEKQLAEVLYPTKTGWVHGWITNLQNKIHDRWHYKWHNGTTIEPVYGSPAGKDKIGTIFSHEKATPLFKAGNRIALLYNTDKGMETKFGYVDYNGEFKF